MLRRKDTPPATPTTPEQWTPLLSMARPVSTSFNEDDETEYVRKTAEKAAYESALYSPGNIPNIAIEMVEERHLGRANVDIHDADITPTFHEATISNSVPLTSDTDHNIIISTEKDLKSDTRGNPTVVIDASEIEWEQGCSSAAIRRMSRSNKWIPAEEEDEQVRARREQFHTRSHGSASDGGSIEKPQVHKVSQARSEGPELRQHTELSLDSALNKPPVLVNMRLVGATSADSRSPMVISPLQEQPPSPQIPHFPSKVEVPSPLQIGTLREPPLRKQTKQYAASKRPSSLNAIVLDSQNSKMYSSTSSTPIWSPPHSYVPPASPLRSVKNNNPPPSPRHHYVPMLNQNFNRPIAQTIVISPLRSRTFEYLAPFTEGVTAMDDSNFKRHSLPLITREANAKGTTNENGERYVSTILKSTPSLPSGGVAWLSFSRWKLLRNKSATMSS
ncbi:unnamed protein product [Toxocara canis]|uniref:Similar to n=1 Tax=Toxocara canis TaxID=6265 RepID=A0A183VAQ2_TOXCA|nr:unnamed protein product [Toxocara canis]